MISSWKIICVADDHDTYNKFLVLSFILYEIKKLKTPHKSSG